MNLATVFPPMLVGGRPLDFSRIYDDPRGTTGSEIQILTMSKELANRGHSVTLYIPSPNASEWEGVHIEDMSRLGPDSEHVDAVCVSLDVNVLRYVSPKALRVCFQQVNDFWYGTPGFDEYVDVYVSPSEPHREHMISQGTSTASKWVVVPNGCYPDEYLPRDPVPGRCVYISSPDRGLHLALQEWLAIRKAVPHAELKIFYWSLDRWLNDWRGKPEPAEPIWAEHWRRAKYVEKVLPPLKRHGVSVVGSVSRNQILKELSQAEVMTYPCSVVAWTEGFSCAILEGCASGALPIISRVDALGHLYGNAVPMVDAPAQQHMMQWREMVIQALEDPSWAHDWRVMAKARAKDFAWPDLAEKFEKVLEERRKS
jgi:glycosyltransferase involved in cell wall biosynthesis